MIESLVLVIFLIAFAAARRSFKDSSSENLDTKKESEAEEREVPVVVKRRFEIGTSLRIYESLRSRSLDFMDFSDINLNGLDFSGSSLLSTDFTRAVQVGSEVDIPKRAVQFFCCALNGAVFRGSEMTGANFAGSELVKADFSGAVLINADFRGTDLTNAKFIDANLAGADFLGAELNGAEFRGAFIDGALDVETGGDQ